MRSMRELSGSMGGSGGAGRRLKRRRPPGVAVIRSQRVGSSARLACAAGRSPSSARRREASMPPPCARTLQRACRSSSSRTTAPLRSPPRCPPLVRAARPAATSWSWSTTTPATTTLAVVARARARGRSCSQTGRNAGFAAGANAGAAAATGDLLVFLNPDARPAPGFVEAIAAPLRDGRGWAAWMGLVTAEDGRVVNTNGGVVHFTGIAWAGEAGAPAPGSLAGPREVAFLSGACLAVPRARVGARRRLRRGVTSCTTRTSTSRCGCASRAGASGVEPAAVVDHDYEFAKGPEKWRLLERNRWATIVRCYPGRLLLAARARAARDRARAARRRGGRRVAAAEAPRHGRDAAPAAAAAARAARDPGDPRDPRGASSRAGSPPTSTRRTSGAPGGCAPLRWALRAYWRAALSIAGGRPLR